VIGSVAAYCLRHASCPVTVIPLAALEDRRLSAPGTAQQFR